MYFFVTGTDTEVGKTTVTVELISAITRLGRTCIGLKPIAAGREFSNGTLINEDVEKLRRVSVPVITVGQICRYELHTPCAPHLAATLDGVAINKTAVIKHIEQSKTLADHVFVEGVGGFNVPLNEDWGTADLALDLGFPVILVVGMRLGCINHALLTYEAIKTRGLQLAGWIANEVESDFDHCDENVSTIAGFLGDPIGRLPYLTDQVASGTTDYFSLDNLLNFSEG